MGANDGAHLYSKFKLRILIFKYARSIAPKMKSEDLYVRSFRGEDNFNEFVMSLGGDPVAITRASGLPLSPPRGWIIFDSFSGVCRLFEAAAAQTNEPYFGLKWALHQPTDFRFSGPMVYLLTKAIDMRHWLDLAVEYQKIHTNGIKYRYEADKAADSLTGIVSVHPLAPPCRHMIEQILAAIALMGRQFIPDFKLKRVTFQHSAPEDMTLYEKIFQCPVTFNADQTTIVLEYSYIELKNTNLMTKISAPFVKKYMDWRIAKHPKAKQTITMLVAETIPVILGVNGSDIHHVSQALNLHPKKLQRLLREENTHYSAVLDEVRKNIAARLLVETEISIVRLAKMLDYSSDRAFTTASKRWFEMSATDYRTHARLQ